MASLFSRTKTPLGFKSIRRKPYFLFNIKSTVSAPLRLLRGLNRVSGRGLTGTQTIFSKASWTHKTRFHIRLSSLEGLYSLCLVAGFLPRPRNLAHSVILRSALGGYALGLATQFHQLFTYCQVAPDSPLVATALWAQKSWWWRLNLLAPHTPVSRIPRLHGTGFYAVAAGTTALFISGNLWGSWAFLLLPSGQPKFIPVITHVLLGAPHPLEKNRRSVILAGDACRYGRKPHVRGTAKNPNDHPNGGRTRALRLSQTPWAQPAKRSRKPKTISRLKPLSKRNPKGAQSGGLDPRVFIGLYIQAPDKLNPRSRGQVRLSRRVFSFVSRRSFRIIFLGVCQRKVRLDSYLSERFLSFLFSDRLCYMTFWFLRAPRISN